MDKKYVKYHGVQIIAGWPEKIRAAQKKKAYVIDGVEYPRIPYGKEDEDWGADERPCGDCAVVKGQLHVPGCDVEYCPVCGGQAISCERSGSLDRSRFGSLWKGCPGHPFHGEPSA